jgi:GLPGLI family protein
MKLNFSNLVLLFIAFSFNCLNAQKSGIVTYNHTTFFEAEGMPSDFPKSFTNVMMLKYNENNSIYQRDPDHIEEEPMGGGGGRRYMRMANRNNNIQYKSLKDKTTIEQVDFFGKNFVVSDSIEKFPWKISAGEQKTILGKMCMKATYSDSTSKYVVFFTPQIPISTGPDKYANLPGLILEYQSAKTHIIATEIKENADEITPPSKGDKLTRAEFVKLRDQKIAEQKEMWGNRGGGNVRIIRN